MKVGKIFVPNCSGQMCNKLIYFVHALATAFDCKRDLVYFFGEDAHRFSDLHPEALDEVNVHCFNWRRSKIVDGICGWLEGHIHPDRDGFAATCPGLVRRFRDRSCAWPIVLWDWYFRNHEGVARHRERIFSYLRAKDVFVARAKDIISKAHETADIVVGVHIRRGDYKEAFDGKYYYSDEEYLRFMREFEKSSGKRVRFVVVSNEPVNCEFFQANGVSVVNASASAPEDVVTLSECDYIMGPRSTFSRFAAFYGNKPICWILDRAQRIDIAEFKVLERL